MTAVLWSLIGLILWHYLGYGLVLAALSRFKRHTFVSSPNAWPKVSIIIPVYNEEEVIAQRIGNCLALDYQGNDLEIIVGSDGSIDQTVQIAETFDPQRVKILDFPQNRGRSQVHNDCLAAASGEIVFFTDADTLYEPDCIRKIVRHYRDPKVGCVGGELRSRSFKQGAIGGGLGFYWRWEYALRYWQSRLGVLTKVSGANMSMRKDLYKPLPEDVDIDQAGGPVVILQGHQVVHEPRAIAYEEFPVDLSGELSARRRLTLRAVTALWRYRAIMNPLKHPWIAFHTLSYRVLRYMIPFLLAGAFVLSAFLALESWFYGAIFLLQAVFYILAVIGLLLERSGKTYWPFSYPFTFCWFQVGIMIGVLEFLIGRRVKSYQPIR
jgi:cellulose synthase/poly-beta-1,6-N-acetylglucosamine synthase-like glycosyltransferase